MIISRILATISIIGVAGLVAYEYIQAIELQQRFQSFIIQGPRFTAQDGQTLCERVRELEQRSYGYRDAGKAPLACHYLDRK